MMPSYHSYSDMKIKNLWQDGLAFIAGAALTLAFSPFNVYLIAILSPAILLGLWLKASPKRAFWLGWIFGLGFFGTGVYWVYISIHTFGNAALFLSLFITGGMIAILALFPALNGYLLNKFFPQKNTTKILCAFPALWVLLEWVRSWIFTGFPWLFIGNSQIVTPLMGFAPIFSVYGVSLIVLLAAGLGFKAVFRGKRLLINRYLIFFILLFIIGSSLNLINWTKPSGEPVKVSLVQGNIEQQVKWSPDQVQPTLDRYVALTNYHWDSKIIIWPEAAIPLPLHHASNFVSRLGDEARKHGVALITGVPIKTAQGSTYYNAVITVGNGSGVYVKHHLVPFGEFIPFKSLLGRLLDFLQVPMSDFIPGAESPKPIIANGIKIAPFVCYEIAYPQEVLSRDSDVDLLLTVSNDAWFGDSIAQAQHLQIAQMRSLEMGRPALFVSNNGITAIINAKGRIQAAVPAHETVVLTGLVQPYQGRTPWDRFGIAPIAIILLGLITIAFIRRKKHD